MSLHSLFGNKSRIQIFDNHFVIIESFDLKKQASNDFSRLITFFQLPVNFSQILHSQLRIEHRLTELLCFGGDSWDLFMPHTYHSWPHNDDRIETKYKLISEYRFTVIVLLRSCCFFLQVPFEHIDESLQLLVKQTMNEKSLGNHHQAAFGILVQQILDYFQSLGETHLSFGYIINQQCVKIVN